MKSPCRAACKNVGGICSGCFRTMNEIIGWVSLSEDQRFNIMNALSGEQSTHVCPTCDSPAQCDIANGKETCWCFELEKREMPANSDAKSCLCRQCLSKLPLA
ncbi:DUF1289 domain-containing protein [Vibrio sinensis]|uniref:DUF1289 domain-containing protein n=1 Tax=Vibrio sinensis TaxID=2302434 RepID=A0A3A6RGE4_9VIBR|nr:cysteine-rich CWC family protein [Vibrio sinensis]RJX75791.1 DUF1289 domain-containing protein [Vibrio sinensis]